MQIKYFGTKKARELTENIINGLTLTGNEAKDRIIIQNALDSNTGTSDVLYDGNTVYPAKKLVAELKRMRKSNDISKMSDRMYKFLSLNFDIAHYNKMGYIDYYGGRFSDLYNETLRTAVQRIPQWRTDVKNIISLAGIA